MLNKLIEQIYTQITKIKYRYFRRGKCKQCLFFSADEELLKTEQGYCIFNPRIEKVYLTHKCGRIVKR